MKNEGNMSGVILFKNGSSRIVRTGLRRVVCELISERSKYSTHTVQSELTVLPINTDNMTWMYVFRNYSVKVQLNDKTHARLMRFLRKQYFEEEHKYAHLRKRVYHNATVNSYRFNSGVRHAVDSPLIVKPQ